MNYKQSSRSPFYGKIYAYDKNGNQIQELDVLKLVVVYKGHEYKIKELLELVVEQKEALTDLIPVSKSLKEIVSKQQEQIETLVDLVQLLNAKVNLEVK